jgi:hypothetical protein
LAALTKGMVASKQLLLNLKLLSWSIQSSSNLYEFGGLFFCREFLVDFGFDASLL